MRALMLACLSALLAACGSTPAQSATPMLDTRNPDLKASDRLAAADIAWANADTANGATPEDHAKAREVFKSIVWSDRTPRPLRLRLAEHLLTDESPDGMADSRTFTILRLPTEPDRSIVGMMALAAARNGWTEAAPSLVRRLSTPVPGVDDRERIEAMALQRLYPAKTIEEIAFDVFLGRLDGVPAAASGAAIGFDDRVRADAWTVLSRFDPDTTQRRRLILDASQSASGPAAPLLSHLRAAAAELRIVPSTTMELEWLASLHDPDDAANREWWRRVASLAANLTDEQARGLMLRHLEPLRLAAESESDLLTLDTAGLFARLEERLEGRPRNRRTSELSGSKGRSPERPGDWRDDLVWGDLLAILQIDRAVSTPEFASTMLRQAELDRDDRDTEYGGVVEAFVPASGGAERIRAVMFPPRPRDRVSDERFIASQDMLDYSDRSLAHYHLQVQRPKNYKYAGPSSGDLQYARLSNRSCVVFTSLDKDRLGVDYYQSNGATIDLGEIRPNE